MDVAAAFCTCGCMHKEWKKKGEKKKKETAAAAQNFSRYRECEQGSWWEQQVVNMCVNMCSRDGQEKTTRI